MTSWGCAHTPAVLTTERATEDLEDEEACDDDDDDDDGGGGVGGDGDDVMQKLIISVDNASDSNCDGETNENNNLPETRWPMEQKQSCV